jgi:hypothetical protein
MGAVDPTGAECNYCCHVSSEDRPESWTIIPPVPLNLEVMVPLSEGEVPNIDCVELLVNDRMRESTQAVVAQDGTMTAYFNVTLPPGRHQVQARYRMENLWSYRSWPLYLDVRFPDPPEIISVSQADLPASEPLPGRDAVVVTQPTIQIRMANVKTSDTVLIYLDDQLQQSVPSDEHIAQVAIDMPPGFYSLTARKVPMGCNRALASTPSNSVMIHYQPTNVWRRLSIEAQAMIDAQDLEAKAAAAHQASLAAAMAASDAEKAIPTTRRTLSGARSDYARSPDPDPPHAEAAEWQRRADDVALDAESTRKHADDLRAASQDSETITQESLEMLAMGGLPETEVPTYVEALATARAARHHASASSAASREATTIAAASDAMATEALNLAKQAADKAAVREAETQVLDSLAYRDWAERHAGNRQAGAAGKAAAATNAVPDEESDGEDANDESDGDEEAVEGSVQEEPKADSRRARLAEAEQARVALDRAEFEARIAHDLAEAATKAADAASRAVVAARDDLSEAEQKRAAAIEAHSAARAAYAGSNAATRVEAAARREATRIALANATEAVIVAKVNLDGCKTVMSARQQAEAQRWGHLAKKQTDLAEAQRVLANRLRALGDGREALRQRYEEESSDEHLAAESACQPEEQEVDAKESAEKEAALQCIANLVERRARIAQASQLAAEAEGAVNAVPEEIELATIERDSTQFLLAETEEAVAAARGAVDKAEFETRTARDLAEEATKAADEAAYALKIAEGKPADGRIALSFYRQAEIERWQALAERQTALAHAKQALAHQLAALGSQRAALRQQNLALVRWQSALDHGLSAKHRRYSSLSSLENLREDSLRRYARWHWQKAGKPDYREPDARTADTATARKMRRADRQAAIALDCLSTPKPIGPCGDTHCTSNSSAADGEACEKTVREYAENFRFLAPAHFPVPGFGARGEVVDRMGALIYEGMRFSCDPNGDYQLEFVARAPALPTTLHLRFLLEKDGHAWRTVTLPPIELRPEGARSMDYKPAIYRVSQCGYSAALDQDEGPYHSIRREGSARFGFGYELDRRP